MHTPSANPIYTHALCHLFPQLTLIFYQNFINLRRDQSQHITCFAFIIYRHRYGFLFQLQEDGIHSSTYLGHFACLPTCRIRNKAVAGYAFVAVSSKRLCKRIHSQSMLCHSWPWLWSLCLKYFCTSQFYILNDFFLPSNHIQLGFSFVIRRRYTRDSIYSHHIQL